MSGVATIAGSGGTTITIVFTTAQSAAAAQAALNGWDSIVPPAETAWTTYTGAALPDVSGTVQFNSAAGPEIAGLGAVLVTGNASLPGFTMPNGYSLAVINASTPVFMNAGVTPTQPSLPTAATIVSGQGGLIVSNFFQAADYFLGGGANVFVQQAPSGGLTTVNLDGVGYFDTSIGSTSIQAYAGSFVELSQSVANPSLNQVGILGGAATTVVEVVHSTAVPIQITGAGPSASIAYLPDGYDATLVTAAPTTIYGASALFGNSGAGRETVVGPPPSRVSAPLPSGLVVSDGNGAFIGLNSGRNQLNTSTIPGAATLMGGDSGDVLSALAPNDTLIAGGGSETIRSFVTTGGDVFVGATFLTAWVDSGAAVNSAVMTGGFGGGNTFEFGLGFLAITGNHATVSGLSGAATVAGATTVAGIATITASGASVPGGVSSIAGAVTVPGGYVVQAPGGGFYAAGSANLYDTSTTIVSPYALPNFAHGGEDLVGDFVSGLDTLALTAPIGNGISISSIAYYAAGAPNSPRSAPVMPELYIQLTDGTQILFLNSVVTPSDFH